MQKLENRTMLSHVINILLVVALFVLAFYFFIGKNLIYMSKTQSQINHEILYYTENALSGRAPEIKIADVLYLADSYNVGVSVKDDTGVRNISRPPDSKALILRLEVGGHVVTRDIKSEDKNLKVKLTYFKPYLADEDTIKFIPAFVRLVLLFTVFAIGFSVLVSIIYVTLIKRDINKIRSFIIGLIKGSSTNLSSKINYSEFGEIMYELKSLQAQTLKREELKKRMTSDLAHELRTPLTTLQSHLEALIDGVWQPTPDRLNSCHEEIMRLIRLVGDLEKLSKIEDETITLQKSNFNLTDLAKSIGNNFQGEIGLKSVTLNINGQEQLIKADKDKISQVFVNLLSNSLKYSPHNGKVLIDITGDKQYVYVVINDSGVGIPEKDLPNVFNRLYRSDTSRTRFTGGAGIGLTIAKAVVEAHGGSIDIVSQAGLGTEITMILPR